MTAMTYRPKMAVAARVAAAVALVASLVLTPAGAALSERRDQAVYGIYLLGFKVGVLEFQGQADESRYSASGVIRSTGLVAAIAKVRYEAATTGRVSGGRLVPQTYREKADTGTRQSQAVMRYRRGVPQVKEYDSPQGRRSDHAVDPATQGGTYDPMTAVYSVFRDVPPDELCNRTIHTFDGQRRGEVTLSEPRVSGDKATCKGVYRRVAGFSAKEMAEKRRFPFDLTFIRLDNGWWRLKRITTETTFGRATISRRG